MKKIKAFTQKPYLLIFLCVCIFIILSAFKLGAFRASTSKNQVDFPVTTRVPTIAILDVKVDDHSVYLLLRNDSDKAITAISLSSSGVNYRSDLINSNNIIASGASYTERCGLPSSTGTEKGITVLAVVYEDGTSDGTPEFVGQILDARAGAQAQLARILPLLREIAATPKSMRLMQKREAIKLKFEQLPEEEQGKSFAFCVGLHDAKELAIDKLKQLEQIEQEKGEDAARQILPRVVNSYEKRNLSISNSLKRVQ
jgi:hypothetical protein